MTITKEDFVDLQEKFDKVIKLIEEDSKLDPENEPFISKYSARQILIGMKANIENLLRNHEANTPEHIKLSAMLGSVYLYLGMVSIDTEELSAGEKHLEKCNTVIESYYLKPEMIMVSLNMFNQFGILWSQREPEKSKIYLDKAEQLYLDFKQNALDPIDIKDLFQANLEVYNVELAKTNLEKVHTLTLYYLAQIFGALKDALKSSVYCHITLQRQLEMKDYESIDWALNSATLSQFFMEKNGFKQARHHLAASCYILGKHEEELNAITERNEAYDAKMEEFKHRSADVARCWVKYGLFLLQKSKERLLNHTDDIDKNCSLITDLSKCTLSSDSTVSIDDLQQLEFKGIDVKSIESQVTDEFVLTLEDAKLVFRNIQSWCNKAKEYYTLDTLASDYIEIIQDLSQSYLNLLFFDEDPDNRAKLHKRRINLLTDILSKVEPKYYLQYCRQIWFELGQTYAEILDIKIEKLRESAGRPESSVLTKINFLVEKSVLNYMDFIKSYEEQIEEDHPIKTTNTEMPKTIPEEAEKPFLQALFHVAGLYTKYITLDKERQRKNVELTIKYYNRVIHYYEQSEKAKEYFKVEYDIAKEMVTLLPLKLRQ